MLTYDHTNTQIHMFAHTYGCARTPRIAAPTSAATTVIAGGLYKIALLVSYVHWLIVDGNTFLILPALHPPG